MDCSTLCLIALDFHDGPTEGFVTGLERGFAHFFKVVAWDDSQDRRLYLLGRIEESSFHQLRAMLEISSPNISAIVLTPAWHFYNGDRKAQAEQLVAAGRRSLNSPALLAVGFNLLDDVEFVTPTKEQLRYATELAALKSPGRMDDWLALGA